MSDAAEKPAGSTTAAFEELCGNLAYARDLVGGGRHLQRLKVTAFDVADLYRAAWVQAVSALDHWVHRELYDRALAFALDVGQARPPRFLELQIPMRLFEDVHHHAGALQQAFADHLRDLFGYQSFQAPDKIKQALAYVSEVPLWPAVATYLRDNDIGNGELSSQEKVVGCLRSIVGRRNGIAHEADRDPEDGTLRLAISAEEAGRTVDRIEWIATAIAAVLGPPPTAESRPAPPDDDPPADPPAEPTPVGLTPKQELYRQFWAEFRPVVERHGWTRAASPAQNWWNMPGGVTGTTWALSFSRFGCRAELYFEHPDPATNLARWRVLSAHRDEIEDRFDGQLIFDDLPTNKGCRIETRLIGVSVEDRSSWPRIHRWMEESQSRLRAAVAAVGGVPNTLATPAGA